jgi:hypothetical protein
VEFECSAAAQDPQGSFGTTSFDSITLLCANIIGLHAHCAVYEGRTLCCWPRTQIAPLGDLPGCIDLGWAASPIRNTAMFVTRPQTSTQPDGANIYLARHVDALTFYRMSGHQHGAQVTCFRQHALGHTRTGLLRQECTGVTLAHDWRLLDSVQRACPCSTRNCGCSSRLLVLFISEISRHCALECTCIHSHLVIRTTSV